MAERRVPEWLRSELKAGQDAVPVDRTVKRLGLHTVCQEAHCPNRGHCYSRGTATFLILGKACTRACRYCAVDKVLGGQFPLDADEPQRVAQAVVEMGLSYVVLTSVTRDDLADGGASVFAGCVKAIREASPKARVEVLVPDFGGNEESVRQVAAVGVDVFNHNIETVERLFPLVRPVADYRRSLDVLRLYGQLAPSTPLKSGLMLGMGESWEDLEASLRDLREAGVTLLTLGQYLAPTSSHWPVDRYVTPAEFDTYKARALEMGFSNVASGPLVRSSFHADLLVAR